MSDLQLKIDVLEARGLQRADRNGSSDPFVVAKFRGLGKMMKSVQTSIVHNNLNPVWNQELVLYPTSNADVLLIKVYDHDALAKDNLLGMVEVPIQNFFQQGTQDLWVQLMNRKGSWKSLVGGHPTWFSVPGQLHLRFWFGLANQAIQGLGQPQFSSQTASNPSYGTTGYANQGLSTGTTGYGNSSLGSTGFANQGPSTGTTGFIVTPSTASTGYGSSGLATQGLSTGTTGYANQGLSSGYGNSSLGSTGFANQGLSTGYSNQGLSYANTGYSNQGLQSRGIQGEMEKQFTSGFNPIQTQPCTMYNSTQPQSIATSSGFQPVQQL